MCGQSGCLFIYLFIYSLPRSWLAASADGVVLAAHEINKSYRMAHHAQHRCAGRLEEGVGSGLHGGEVLAASRGAESNECPSTGNESAH